MFHIYNHPCINAMNPDEFLAKQGRKRKVILGDGNCLFRAVSYLVHGSQDDHQKLREALVTTVELLREVHHGGYFQRPRCSNEERRCMGHPGRTLCHSYLLSYASLHMLTTSYNQRVSLALFLSTGSLPTFGRQVHPTDAD